MDHSTLDMQRSKSTQVTTHLWRTQRLVVHDEGAATPFLDPAKSNKGPEHPGDVVRRCRTKWTQTDNAIPYKLYRIAYDDPERVRVHRAPLDVQAPPFNAPLYIPTPIVHLQAVREAVEPLPGPSTSRPVEVDSPSKAMDTEPVETARNEVSAEEGPADPLIIKVQEILGLMTKKVPEPIAEIAEDPEDGFLDWLDGEIEKLGQPA